MLVRDRYHRLCKCQDGLEHMQLDVSPQSSQASWRHDWQEKKQGLPPAPLSKWINWTGASAAKGANAGLCASHILFFQRRFDAVQPSAITRCHTFSLPALVVCFWSGQHDEGCHPWSRSLAESRKTQFGRASLVESLGQSRPDRLLALHYSSSVHDSTNSRFRISKAFFIGTLALFN